jgi:integrase
MGAVLRLISTFGLRRKEALMFRPWRCVVAFEDTGLPLTERQADQYAAIVAGSKGGRPRHIAIDSPQRQAAIEHAREIVTDPGAAMGRPGDTLKQAMARYMYVLAKFGVTSKVLGVTGHGLRHEVLIGQFEKRTGQPAPVRSGKTLPTEIDQPARQEVATLAGHCRRSASSAYIGAVKMKRSDKDAQGFDRDS